MYIIGHVKKLIQVVELSTLFVSDAAPPSVFNPYVLFTRSSFMTKISNDLIEFLLHLKSKAFKSSLDHIFLLALFPVVFRVSLISRC